MKANLTRRRFTGALLLAAAWPAALRAAPTVFPTGTTIYDPERAWNGFTVLSTLDTPAVLVIDMNGRTVKRWDGFNVSAGGPARVLPGGVLIAPTGAFPRHQESTALVAVDFDGARTVALRSRRGDRDRRRAAMERAPAPRLAAQRLSRRLLLAAVHPGRELAARPCCWPTPATATRRSPACCSRTTG